MKKTLMKTLCVLSVLSFCSVTFAQQDNSCCPAPCKSQCEPCRECEICPPCEPCKPCCTEVPKTGEPCNCAYNAPARIDPACGWDAWLTGTFLYWQAKEKGLDLGYEYSISETTPPTVHYTSPVNMEFDYHPAFKVGFGFSFCRDDWTLFLEYTRFNGIDCESIDISDVYDSEMDYLTSAWFDSDLSASYLKGKWELNYNIFDLELGRPYYLGKKLVFKPHYGLKGGWIDQNFKLKTINVVPGEITIEVIQYSKNEQNTWLVGPRVGLDTDWLVSCDFRIFGNVAGSLSYQNFEVSHKIITPIQEGIITKTVDVYSNDFSQITPNVEFSLGLGYGTYFCNYQWYFDLTVGYDFNYFWNQNWIRHTADMNSSFVDGDAGNLMLHGLNVTARIDF